MFSGFYARCYMVSVLLLLGIKMAVSSEIDAEYSVKLLESSPSAEHVARVKKIFTDANRITVKYVPNANMGSGINVKEDLSHDWKYMFAYQCPVTCEKNAKKIQDYFASGRLQNKACPKFYYALVELPAANDVVHQFYIHQSGQCFTLNGKSYFTESSFGEFVNESKLYPDFVDVN